MQKFELEKKLGRNGSHCTTETNLHVGKKFGRIGSHCTTRRGAREEAGPTVPLGRNCEVGKKFARNGSHYVSSFSTTSCLYYLLLSML